MDVGNSRTDAVVVSDRRDRAASLATAVLVERLSRRHVVTVIDLAGFGVAMSADERVAYETDEPIVDPRVRASAEAVGRAEVLAFVTAVHSYGLSAPVKGWLDRVLVPGVGFEIDDAGRMRPGLRHV
ncbi:MAG: NAD(P)H-dependent oxidoreductase, partial [Ilumatobacteraceae bacterium]